MRHDCPHCGQSLKRKLVRSTPAPGQRRFLPLRAIACCPLCKGLLARNEHWTDKCLVLLALPFFMVVQARPLFDSRGLWLLVASSVALLMLGAGAIVYWRHMRTWPLYRKYEAATQAGAAASPSKPKPKP